MAPLGLEALGFPTATTAALEITGELFSGCVTDCPLASPDAAPESKKLRCLCENSVADAAVSAAGELLRTLQGHSEDFYLNSVAVSSDARLIASVAREAEMRLWDLHTGVWLSTSLPSPFYALGMSGTAECGIGPPATAAASAAPAGRISRWPHPDGIHCAGSHSAPSLLCANSGCWCAVACHVSCQLLPHAMAAPTRRPSTLLTL